MSLNDKAIDRLWNKIPERYKTPISVLILIIAIYLIFLVKEDAPIATVKNIESNNASNYGVNSGLILGKLEVNQVKDNQRHLNANSKEELLKKIVEFEKIKKIERLVVSASYYEESQRFAKEIINYLISINKWEVVPEAILVFDREWESEVSKVDVAFNLSDQYGYKNSLEIIVIDR